MLRKAKMVAFSGLDNSGKSTQINILSKYLSESKIKYNSYWIRGGYTPLFELLKKILRFTFKKNIPERGNSPIRDKYLKNDLVRKLWIGFAIFDLLLFSILFLRIKRYFVDFILLDRYIIDTQIDFKLNYPDENFENWLIWKILIQFALPAIPNFVFTIPTEIAAVRSKEKHEPFPDKPEILIKRFEFYNKIVGAEGSYCLIDGLNPKNQIFKVIRKKLNIENLYS